MPRIPQYLAEVTPAAAPQPNAPPNALDFVGGQLTGLGRTLQARQAEADRLLEQQQERQGNLWLTKSMAELRASTSEGFLKSQATAPADGTGFTAARLAEYQERFDGMLAGAPTPEAAELFQAHALAVRSDLLADSTGFEAKLHGLAVVETFNGALNSYAATIRADPGQLDGSLAESLAAIGRLELPADERAGLQATTRETLGLAYFNARLDSDPRGARAELLAGTGPALMLDPGTRERMLGAADVEIRRREAEARAAAAEARQIAAFHARNRIEDEQAAAAAGGTTGLATDADWRLAYGDEGWQAAKANLEATRGVAVAATELALVPPSQWQAAIDAASPSPQGENYKAEAGRRDFMLAAAGDLAKESEQDPALYAVRHSPELAAAFEAAGNDPAKLQAAIDLSLTIQERLEVPPAERRVLSASQAKAVVAEIAAAPPERILATIEGLAANYGEHWGAVSGELVAAGLPAPLTAIVALDNDPYVRGEIAKAIPVGETTLRSALPKQSVTEFEDRLAGNLETWLGTMQSPAAAEPYVAALRLAGLAMMQRMTPTAAADRVAAAITTRYEFAGDYRVPQTWSAGRVEAGLDRFLEDLREIDMAGGDPNLSAATRVAAGIEALRAAHHWLTNGDETGVYLLDENWRPVKRNGRPLEVSFERAELLGAPASGVPVRGGVAPAGLRRPETDQATGIGSLDLNPQEQYLYDYHRRNLENLGAGGVKNPDGTVSTVLSTTVERDGRHYVIPTVWGGKILKPWDAIKRAGETGWSKWPSYATEAEAQARYQAMHRFMDSDVGEP